MMGKAPPCLLQGAKQRGGLCVELLDLPHPLPMETPGKDIQSGHDYSMSDPGVLGFLLQHPKGEQ